MYVKGVLSRERLGTPYNFMWNSYFKKERQGN
jgi:hypothetical protein